MSEISLTVDRPKFREIRFKKDRPIPEQYDLVQLKMDGIWGCMKISHGQWGIYSRTGKLKADGVIDNRNIDAVLLGEFMFGSHWGHKMNKNRHFYIFDCLRWRGMDVDDLPLLSRLSYIEEVYHSIFDDIECVRLLQTYPVENWRAMWDEYIVEYGYEGLVFKDSSSLYNDKRAWARMKAVVEIDYICTGFRPAEKGTKYEGQAGSVIGTLIDKDVHVTCGGLSEDLRRAFTDHPERYIGQVFKAKGNNWYPSGAIRHPQFLFWRADKEPEECRYEQIPEGVRCLA
jgi:ATP-dependent DNA ligase